MISRGEGKTGMIWNGWKRNTVREVQRDRKGGGARRIREAETTFNRPHICVDGLLMSNADIKKPKPNCFRNV